MIREHRRFRVTGRVQGVGFRRFVEVRARALGLAGWVRNLHDGSVEVIAGGDAAALDALRADLRRGPRGAEVDEVSETAEPDASELPFPFSVRFR
jgi:acylphosphatase